MRLCGFEAGLSERFFLIAGPCVLESRSLALEVAQALLEITRDLGIPFIFKGSYDKANRTSIKGFRGPGLEEGLAILEEIRSLLRVPVLTDVHAPEEARMAASVADILQIPAFLCRQTDLIVAAAQTGRVLHLKKGQFLSPWEMPKVVEKARAAGAKAIAVGERGVMFGYQNLVVDMRSLAVMRETGCPVVFDATHSVQRPGALGESSGGDRRFVPVLSRAAVAAGVSGIFLETHPDPDKALSDGPNAWPLGRMQALLEGLVALDGVVKSRVFLEEEL
mgnify:CR=1 FL=1